MQDESASPFEGWHLIHSYTRAQALEDGVLIDVSETAKEVGLKYPVAITARVMGEIVATPCFAARHGETDTGRLWDVLWILRVAIHLQKPGDDPSTCHFPVLATDCKGEKIEHRLWSLCGPGDHMEPVLTIMMQGED